MFLDIIIILRYFVLLIYAVSVLICVMFTFCLEVYLSFSEFFNFEFECIKVKNPVGKGLDVLKDVDNWLIAHHKLVGPVLITFSFLAMIMLFDVLSKL